MNNPCPHLENRWPGHHAVWCKAANTNPSRGTCDNCWANKLEGKHLIATAKPAKPRPPCNQLGRDTGMLAFCKTCHGGISLKIFECGIESVCTIGRHGDGIKACCADCPHYHPSHEPAKTG